MNYYSWGWAKFNQRKAERLLWRVAHFMLAILIFLVVGIIVQEKSYTGEVGSVFDSFFIDLEK